MQLLDKEADEGGAARSAHIVEPKEGWPVWAGNKVWISNSTGCDIIVKLSPVRPRTMINSMSGGAGASAGVAGANVSFSLELQHNEPGSQVDNLAAGNTGRVMFVMSPSSRRGANVTAARVDDNSQLFCISRYVKAGHCLQVLQPSFQLGTAAASTSTNITP